MTPELATQKKRLMVMAVLNVAAVVLALGFVVAWAMYDASWALGAFVATLVLGFGAQIWFIAGFRRNKGA